MRNLQDRFSHDQANLFPRWRTSFLWSLIFGVPSMVIMMYFMFAKPPEDSQQHQPHLVNTTSNGTTTVAMTTTTRSAGMSHGHGYQIMIMPGLSLDNLLMFLLATPVQVGVLFCFGTCILKTPLLKAMLQYRMKPADSDYIL